MMQKIKKNYILQFLDQNVIIGFHRFQAFCSFFFLHLDTLEQWPWEGVSFRKTEQGCGSKMLLQYSWVNCAPN